uniref:Uncharacterized protein n=1 Tax=Chromera velia CCMP2878 TaxID=1169474 RepID=A0A0G4HUN7_9ALVE|eukprot:Cvel_8680.t1-p1 / transcript=Cvel_8680.t1 / gene=Cvel_8680 / organism=Chromera_velia_CCMP2878 / gene_product=hypothetical protein / transcript_product=hypothetical protein / location=Cvel_scaffold484:50746-53783(+) / protein_length=504 / sequence_SO=supercontig / SO=protein_coding / is_pseudo=false
MSLLDPPKKASVDLDDFTAFLEGGFVEDFEHILFCLTDRIDICKEKGFVSFSLDVVQLEHETGAFKAYATEGRNILAKAADFQATRMNNLNTPAIRMELILACLDENCLSRSFDLLRLEETMEHWLAQLDAWQKSRVVEALVGEIDGVASDFEGHGITKGKASQALTDTFRKRSASYMRSTQRLIVAMILDTGRDLFTHRKTAAGLTLSQAPESINPPTHCQIENILHPENSYLSGNCQVTLCRESRGERGLYSSRQACRWRPGQERREGRVLARLRGGARGDPPEEREVFRDDLAELRVLRGSENVQGDSVMVSEYCPLGPPLSLPNGDGDPFATADISNFATSPPVLWAAAREKGRGKASLRAALKGQKGKGGIAGLLPEFLQQGVSLETDSQFVLNRFVNPPGPPMDPSEVTIDGLPLDFRSVPGGSRGGASSQVDQNIVECMAEGIVSSGVREWHAEAEWVWREILGSSALTVSTRKALQRLVLRLSDRATREWEAHVIR